MIMRTGGQRVRDMVRVGLSDRDKKVLGTGIGLGFRVKVRVSIRSFYTHCDDPQTQSVDERVIN